MAKPAGAIEPSDGGYPAINGSPSYAAFSFRLPFMPQHWNNGYNARHRITPLVQVTIAAGVNLDDSFSFKGTEIISTEIVTTAGAQNASWETRDQTQPLKGYCSGFPALAGADTLPRYVYAHLKFEKDASGNAEVMAIHVELTDTDTYSTPDPSGARAAELTDRGTIRLYDADEPASAWHAMWLLAHTYNKACYEARQSWSIPL